jgi:hypothetical protein
MQSLSITLYFLNVIPLFLKAATFSQVLETDEGSDEKAITAMGLLNTIETLLNVMEDQPEIMSRLQPTVLQVVGHIFSQSVMGKCAVVWYHRAPVQTGVLCLCTEQGDVTRRESVQNCILRGFMICSLHSMLLGWSNKGR